MLHRLKSTIVLEPTVSGVSSQSFTLHTNASGASGLSYSAEDASSFLKNLFSSFKSAFPKKGILKNFKQSDTKLLDELTKKVSTKELSRLDGVPISIQDGLQVNLKTWIVTLDECYNDISKELLESLENLISLFATMSNDPDRITSLSQYGFIEQTKLDQTNVKFQEMFGSSKRSNKSTVLDMISNKSDLEECRNAFSDLVVSRNKLNTSKIDKDIDRINVLADELLEKYALRLANNRRAVSDLALCINTIAEAVSFLSLIDYSYLALENTVKEMNRKI